MVEALNRAKIALNIHVEDDLPYKVNMRTFEITGCGAFLLTDKAYGIEKMFNVGKELVTYASEGDLIEMAKYYLDSRKEREEIANRAQERSYREHSYEVRVRMLLDITGRYKF